MDRDIEQDDTLLVDMQGIRKEFPGVLALDNVDFNLRRGEVHVLLGENGAGKSTLMKILSGLHKKNGGQILIDGQEQELGTPQISLNLGISTIYQELNLVSEMSVAENLFLGKEKMKGKLIDWKKMYRSTDEVLKDMNIEINPKEKIRNLGVAEKQMIEIAKALSDNARIIIFDEPTAVLTEKEITRLFEIINSLKEQGVGIIYISHRLEEIPIIGDRITVLRDGGYVGTIDVEEDDTDIWIKMMVGRELKDKYPSRQAVIGEDALKVENLSREGLLHDISFNVRKGEILGLSGLVGSGRTELARAIIGADKIDCGIILIDGKVVDIKCPSDSVKHGIGYLTEERKADGLVLKLSVKENITMASLDKSCCNKGVISFKREKDISNDLVRKLQIKVTDINQKSMNLSGGNQQKVVIGKWLCAQSDIFIFDEPTRGIDVGAKFEVYKLMNELVEKGAAIIMISSDLPEILGMSDRVLVMREGKITGAFDIQDATQEKILNKAWGI